ncbi:type II toxin-antitoxin system VapC family toxin [Dyadobacter chenwenxiniae]|uniref:Type II toxin-antitoxin system VapC family toxin n=1 Tax=Dyadobacter chenwenxiniae TaxID=2906456 RepID=A0A9X1PGS3_9BACT|nr:type II toxin-antitoxin system VapC family toxin [Dyadobacter chenwenxiniae]MCF0060932.1 type II toxin-antitoxin system VapC family toxin [Dyadobacter chenwenxiniae]UON80760.1 type II toxin-antitoxin system VapC family toxin [Dyadobacter chenwenxiniae]
MNYLIDTHILLWHSDDNQKLSHQVTLELNSSSASLYVSHATYWEMAIKKGLGKLDLNVPISEFRKMAMRNSFHSLSFDNEHYDVLEQLPLLHADPFDRMIIAQAIAERLTIITQDKKFALYQNLVPILWN